MRLRATLASAACDIPRTRRRTRTGRATRIGTRAGCATGRGRGRDACRAPGAGRAVGRGRGRARVSGPGAKRLLRRVVVGLLLRRERLVGRGLRRARARRLEHGDGRRVVEAEGARLADDRLGRGELRNLFAQLLVPLLFLRALRRDVVEVELALDHENVERDEQEQGRERHDRTDPETDAGLAAPARRHRAQVTLLFRTPFGRAEVVLGLLERVDLVVRVVLLELRDVDFPGDERVLAPGCLERAEGFDVVGQAHGASRSTARSRALSARGFSAISSSDGRNGRRVTSRTSALRGVATGSFAGSSSLRPDHCSNVRFTRRSSSEWYASTSTRPPGPTRWTESSRPSARFGNSRLTSMRIAWNVRRAGCGPRRRAGAGIARLIASTRSNVEVSGRARTISRAMRRAKRSSPNPAMTSRSVSSSYSFTTIAAVSDCFASMRMSSGASKR